MKDELGRKLLKEFAELRANTYNYLIDNVNEDTMINKNIRKNIRKILNGK